MDFKSKILGLVLTLALAGPLCCCQRASALESGSRDSGNLHSCCDQSRQTSHAPGDRPCDSCSPTLVRTAEAGTTPAIIPQWIDLGLFIVPEIPRALASVSTARVRFPDSATLAPPPPLYLLQRRLLI